MLSLLLFSVLWFFGLCVRLCASASSRPSSGGRRRRPGRVQTDCGGASKRTTARTDDHCADGIAPPPPCLPVIVCLPARARAQCFAGLLAEQHAIPKAARVTALRRADIVGASSEDTAKVRSIE